ncbi:MAG: hypothetical protein A4E28_01577 [Methanocella sp. PtaU1.Bin125]|nr:MAG: hypothetical protein A4E28_01577 [Methanocella sp. PtaU1.Bin125]
MRIVDRGIEQSLTGLAYLFARHWLAVLIGLNFLFILPIVGYPILMATGDPALQSIADVIHLVYHATCHQLPERSLFIGEYEMAVCSRCFAIYVAFLAGCVLFAFVRTKLKIWSLFWFAALCVPMAIDGFAQLFRVPLPRAFGPGGELVWMAESTNEIRVITGLIFGFACALYVMPFMQEIFNGDSSAPVKKDLPAGSDQRPAAK